MMEPSGLLAGEHIGKGRAIQGGLPGATPEFSATVTIAAEAAILGLLVGVRSLADAVEVAGSRPTFVSKLSDEVVAGAAQSRWYRRGGRDAALSRRAKRSRVK